MRFLFALLVMLLPFSALADSTLRVERVWVQKPYTTQQKVTAGYLQIINNGKEADTLLSAKSPAAVRVEIHSMRMNDGVMQMRVMDKVSIPAGGRQIFSAGDVHLMLMEVKHEQFKDGGTVPITLTFEKAGEITVQALVKQVSE